MQYIFNHLNLRRRSGTPQEHTQPAWISVYLWQQSDFLHSDNMKEISNAKKIILGKLLVYIYGNGVAAGWLRDFRAISRVLQWGIEWQPCENCSRHIAGGLSINGALQMELKPAKSWPVVEHFLPWSRRTSGLKQNWKRNGNSFVIRREQRRYKGTWCGKSGYISETLSLPTYLSLCSSHHVHVLLFIKFRMYLILAGKMLSQKCSVRCKWLIY